MPSPDLKHITGLLVTLLVLGPLFGSVPLNAAPSPVDRREFAAAHDGSFGAVHAAARLTARLLPDGTLQLGPLASLAVPSVEVSLRSSGRPGSEQLVARPAVLERSPTYLRWRRSPGLDEWFSLDARGLQQAFDVTSRPAGAGPLQLVLTVRGASLEPAADRRSVKLTATDGSVVRCSGLRAWDADARPLDAAFVARGGELVVEVDDAAARYPLTIDPWFDMAEGDLLYGFPSSEGGSFGESVAAFGDHVVVGAFLSDSAASDSGSTHVFRHDAVSASWLETAVLDGDDVPAHWLGFSVDLWGDVVVASAPRAELAGAPSLAQGAVVVHERDPLTGAMHESARLWVPGVVGEEFGYAVAVWRDTLVVSAPLEDGHGVVYVYERDSATGLWSMTGRLMPSTPGDEWFGGSVAVWREVIAVGGFRSAYVFERESDGTWNEAARLTQAPTASGGFFGISVALWEQRLAVSALLESDSSDEGEGSIYVFERDPLGVWSLAERVRQSVFNGAHVGEQIDLWGDALIASRARGALVLERTDVGWMPTAHLSMPGDMPYSFGSRVSIAGATSVLGSPLHDAADGTSPGAVAIYRRANDTPSVRPVTATTLEDSPVTFSLHGSDADGDLLYLDVDTSPTLGTLRWGMPTRTTTDTTVDVTLTPHPDANGSEIVTLTAFDGTAWAPAATLELTVVPVDDPPVLEPFTSPFEVDEDEALLLEFAASDVDSPTLTWSATGLPRGAVLAPDTGILTWTPSGRDAGTHALTIAVQDATTTVSAPLEIVVSVTDLDGDGISDALEVSLGLDPTTPDSDGDTIHDRDELGDPYSPSDTDHDDTLDALDLDSDNDARSDADEAGDGDVGTPPFDTDGDGLADFRDRDSDDDGLHDGADNCPLLAAPSQLDTDRDGTGDGCDDDDDDDGVEDALDNCPRHTNPTQEDTDADGAGDACQDRERCDDGLDNDDDGDTDCTDDECAPTPDCQPITADDGAETGEDTAPGGDISGGEADVLEPATDDHDAGGGCCTTVRLGPRGPAPIGQWLAAAVLALLCMGRLRAWRLRSLVRARR